MQCLQFIDPFIFAAQLARKQYEQMRREAASIRIQKHQRAHMARKSYTTLKASAIVIQTGLRAMAARNEFRFRRRTKAAAIVQVTNFRKFVVEVHFGKQNKCKLFLLSPFQKFADKNCFQLLTH